MAQNRQHIIEFLDKALADGINMCEEDMHFSYKGVLYPTVACSPETLQVLESFEARADDMILAGYPKTGECLYFLV